MQAGLKQSDMATPPWLSYALAAHGLRMHTGGHETSSLCPEHACLGFTWLFVSAGNILVHLDAPRGTRALYDRIAERIGLKVRPLAFRVRV